MLSKIKGIGAYALKHLGDSQYLKQAEQEMNFMEKQSIQGLYFEAPDYPNKLKHCIDGPIVLFQKGQVNWTPQPIISIVGTRNITSYGRSQCEKIIQTLAVFNPTIVSGFAYGADITAHKAALNNKLQTVACMAQGLQNTYPKQHIKYRQLLEINGGFVTDFWSTAPMNPSNFIKRNRLIAGLSEATIIIESAEKGGSLTTAEMAFGYNREVFAVPGRISDRQSQGCNMLIKTKGAHLLGAAEDLPFILNWTLKPRSKALQKKVFIALGAEEKEIYNFLYNKGKSSLDSIAFNCKLPTSMAAYVLLSLELKGVLKPLPGKEYELI